jgi:hypothetical protein
MKIFLKLLIFGFLLIFSSVISQQNVLITDNALITTPNASSLLEMNSVNKGLLIPRVALTGSTDGTTIALPETSLLVYNTATNGAAPVNVSPGYYYNAGTPTVPNWIRLFAGPTAGTEWKLLGNAGTVATTNFLGTTDAVDLVFRTNNTEKMRVMSGGNVGIGTDAPFDKLHVAFGDVRVGEISTTPGPAGYGRRLNFSGGNSFLGNSDNTDPIFMARYNVGNDASELHLNLGDNNGYGGAAIDKFYIGNNQGGGWFPKAEFRSDGKVTFSRDGVAECCLNDATLALGENTVVTGRRPGISFHAGGESEGTMNITQEPTGMGVIGANRRIRFFDNQAQGLGIEITGNLWYGTTNSRTQWRDNAGLQGDAGAQSGFYETAAATNYPSTRGQTFIGPWYHLIDIRHSNPANNYAMQFSGSFFDQDVFVRKTDNNPSQPWSRMQTSRDIAVAKVWGTNSFNNANDWREATGWTNFIDVRNGDIIKLDYSFVARLTGGNGNDDFYYYIEFDGCAVGNVLGTSIWLRPAENGAEHDNNRPYSFNNYWDCNCFGQVRFRLWVQNVGDDNWEMHNRVLIATRY